ncbi:hypothetical protein [Spirosoma flavum]|uniref:Chalcone isomerase domain-containing protein n=1 Tax=Spirosoma flavum TaxID=2048557 RepID=A0ABW6APD5_9BACT
MKSLIPTTLFLLLPYFTYGQAGRSMPVPRGVIIAHPSPSFILPIVYQLHDGTALLSNGDLLRGRFLYNRSQAFFFYQDGHSPGQRIYFRRLERLVLAAADTSVTPRLDSTVFLKVQNQFCRRLTIGKIGLYDQVYAVNENKGKVDEVLFTWGDDGKLKRLSTLEKANQWFYEICIQNHWPNPDVFLSKAEIIKRLAQLDPVP